MPTIKNFPNNADEFIGAENVMKWLHGRTSGVFGAEDNLAVTADDALSVSVSDGIGWIANDEADGTVFWNDSEQANGTKLSLPIELPDAIYPRIDRVVVSWETINYVEKPSIEILKGTAASSPVPPSLTNNNLKRQISLAQIYVPEAASKISPDNITDERMNEDVCGLVTAGIGVDTSVMQAQFLALLSKIESELTNLNAGTETMLKTEYDPDLNVKESGGIKAYTNDRLQQVQTSLSGLAADVDNLKYSNAGAHNAVYRGKALGGSVSEEQYAAIKAGTFDDLYIGDYWTIGDINYRIAAFDYFLNNGDTECTDHHAVIVPDTCLYKAQMNSSDTTTGGYIGSAMYNRNLKQAKTTIKAAFNGHILRHRIILSNAVSNGLVSGVIFCDSEVELMCEHMVYGSSIFLPANRPGNFVSNYINEKSQLPLFQHEPSRIVNRDTFWLRDTTNGVTFACVHGDGIAGLNDSSRSYGVRPYFCIY